MKSPLNRRGVSRAEIERITITNPEWQDQWRRCEDYVCRGCGDEALAHPFTNSIMGCLKCGYQTEEVIRYFARVSQPSEHARV